MKKLFGVVSLFLCVFFASCGFNNQSGSIEFSIPLDDIARLSEQNSSRAAGPGEEYVFLLQVKGSRKYYKSKIQTFELDDSFFRGRSQPVNMKMSSLPSDQTYTVLFDMFMQDPYSNQAYHECTGKTEGVTVTPGKTEEVNLKASYVSPHESYVSLKIDFARPSQTTSGDAGMFSQVNLEKKSNKLYYGSQEIKDIYFVRDSNSHFTDSSFKYKLNYVAGASTTSYDLKFEDDVCSIKDFLLGQSYLYTTCISVEKGDLAFAISIPYIEMTGDSNTNIEFDPSLLDPRDLIFERTDQIDNGIYRYVCTIPLSQIAIMDGMLGVWGVSPSTITDGKTFVTTMAIENNDPIINVEKFYYMLQPDNYSSIPLADRYTGNNCILLPTAAMGFDKTSYDLTLPINNLTNASSKKNLILFFDKNENVESYTLSEVGLAGILLPQNSVAFAKTVNYGYTTSPQQSTNPWRLELKYPLGKLETLKNNGSLTVGVSGLISETNIQLSGEVYNAVDIEGNTYHPISKTSAEGTKLSINVTNEYLSDSFVFKEAVVEQNANPDEFYYYLQCTAEYSDTVTDLYILNFNVNTQIQ